jgi:putative NADPH-quinone reductase
MTRRVLVIVGHSYPNSFGTALAEAYSNGVKQAGGEVQELHLSKLNFDPILRSPSQELESDLQMAQDSILWAEHLVFVYPNWWGTMPALLKGFFDRVLLSGFAFRYRKDNPLWDKLLTGRTSHLLVTMDTPSWFYRWVFRQPGHNQMKHTILGFCGIKVTRIKEFAVVRKSTALQRNQWLQQAELMGKQCVR